MALLRGVHPRGRPARSPVVRSLRIAGFRSGRLVRGLSAGAAASRPGAVPVRGSGAFLGAPVEVLRMARRRGRARRGDGPGDARARRCRDVGAALPATTGRARVRSGEGPRAGRGPRARPAGPSDAAPVRRRRRDSGTHVTASAGPGATCAIAAPSASATPRHPENFSRCTEERTGPSNRKGARERASGAGGQSLHEGTWPDAGDPHRSHHGGASGTTRRMHSAQKGQAPEPHPAQRRGNTTSSTRPSIGRR
jgi:hypothetical protein